MAAGQGPAPVAGAYVALQHVDEKAFTGDEPQIELLLANEGLGEAHYQQVVGQLAGMTTGDHPLDAVVGMGISSGATLLGAQDLSKAGLLMVGSNVTGDDLNDQRIQHFSRVSAPNSDDIAVLAQYLRTRPDLRKTMLVHAGNTPAGGDPTQLDLYTASLAQDFKTELGRYATTPDEPFDPTDTGNSFAVIATNLCTTHNQPTTILYGGREPDLPKFIHDLAQRPCAGTPITLAVGIDASDLTSQDNPSTTQVDQDLQAGHITVLCPAWAAPQNWAQNMKTAPQGFAAFVTGYAAAFAPDGRFGAALDDAYASGPITFKETSLGNPSGKPVFVLQLQPSGTTKLLDTYITP